MKQTIYILTFLILTSCGQSNSEQKVAIVSDATIIKTNTKHNIISTEKDNSENNYLQQSLTGFERATLFKLTDTITADFNGDGILDKAVLKKENETSGIIIKHGKTNEEFRIGFGKNFATWTDFDCNWVDYWGLVEDKETSETTFAEDGDVLGSRVVKLQNPSIVIGKDEIGGGLITFINGKYEWIHQAD